MNIWSPCKTSLQSIMTFMGRFVYIFLDFFFNKKTIKYASFFFGSISKIRIPIKGVRGVVWIDFK